MNNNIYIQSLSSLNILEKIFGEDRVSVNSNSEVMLDGLIILDDESNRLMLFNKNSKMIRRKNKNECKYLNFYSGCSKLVDYFLAIFPQFETIGINDKENIIILFLKTSNNNKNMYEISYEKEENTNRDFYVTNYIKYYLDTYSK